MAQRVVVVVVAAVKLLLVLLLLLLPRLIPQLPATAAAAPYSVSNCSFVFFEKVLESFDADKRKRRWGAIDANEEVEEGAEEVMEMGEE